MDLALVVVNATKTLRSNDILAIPTDVDFDDWAAWHFDSMAKLAVQTGDEEMGRDASSYILYGSTGSNDVEFKCDKICQLKCKIC
jgi:hypothetical protein